MLDGRWKPDIERRLRPVGVTAAGTGLKADHLTALGLGLAVVASVVIANGALRGGALLLLACSLPDALDGAVAKATGTAGPRGAFFDSVADRVTDALLLGGITWYLSDTYGGQIALLPMAVMAASMLISYERAKAEALGFDARGGIMERAERLVLLGFGLIFDSLLVPVLWLMLALTLVTAVQRFQTVWRQASAAPPQQPLAARWKQRRVARPTTSAWRTRARQHRR